MVRVFKTPPHRSKLIRTPIGNRVKVELICPVQFAKMFTTAGLKVNKKTKLEEIDPNENDPESAEKDNIDDTRNNSGYDVGFDRYAHTDTDTDIVIPIYSKPIPILASRIHTDTDIWFGIQIKPIPIIGITRYHTDICIPI